MSADNLLDSTRVPRVGDGVLAIAGSTLTMPNSLQTPFTVKDCFGATPKPARETRALPNRVVHACRN
jgi:hypothetical protein